MATSATNGLPERTNKRAEPICDPAPLGPAPQLLCTTQDDFISEGSEEKLDQKSCLPKWIPEPDQQLT